MKTIPYKRMLFIIAAAALMLAGCSKDDVSGGEGIDPTFVPEGYDLVIATEAQLRAFADSANEGRKINGKPYLEARVLQTADITLDPAQEWKPIGKDGASIFRGVYNGNGHTITGLTIKEAPLSSISDVIYAGLFAYVGDAVLTGINLRDVQIDVQAGNGVTDLLVGSIVGQISHSTLSLCSVTGRVHAGGGAVSVCVGGIVGMTSGFNGGNFDSDNTISRCRAAVEISVATTNVNSSIEAGGIVGFNFAGSFILSCEAQGKPVIAKGGKVARAGGIAGSNIAGLIAFCRTGESDVTAQNGDDFNHAGGLVGNNIGYLYSSYSRATATAPSGNNCRAGAIVGSYGREEQHCYGAGSPGHGTSDLTAAPDDIIYDTRPAAGAIYALMTGYTDMVAAVILYSTPVYPTTTRYDPTAYPAYGIEPIHVKWSGKAWKKDGAGVIYPEIDMEYEGE